MPVYNRKTYSRFRSRPAQVASVATSVSSGLMSGDSDATYLVLSATGSLSAERVFAPDTGLIATDAGAGNAYTISINNGVVATISGSHFTGPVTASLGLSGTVGQFECLRVGTNGSVAVTGDMRVPHRFTVHARSAAGGSDLIFLRHGVLGNDDTEIGDNSTGCATRLYTGASDTVTVQHGSTIVSTFTANGVNTLSVTASQGVITQLTGTHTLNAAGTSAFVASGSLTITSASNNQVVIAVPAPEQAFFVLTSSFTPTSSIDTPIVWNTLYDPQNMLKSGSRIYFPSQGLWQISTGFRNSSNTNNEIKIFLNSSSFVAYAGHSNVAAGQNGAAISATMRITGSVPAGDYVEIVCRCGGTLVTPTRCEVVKIGTL